jgi:pimeloyl-ACP methyl ester carboxylesterase
VQCGSRITTAQVLQQEKSMEQKANIVLVHGAWADGSSWSKVISILQKQGFNAAGAQLPLTSLDDDITVTRNLLAVQKGPTVLVGHSYGGAVITGAAKNAPNVAALVYIAAFGPDEGESLESLSKQGPPTAGAAQIRPDDHGFLWIDPAGFPEVFAGDVDPVESRIMAVVQKPLSVKSFIAKSGPPAWKTIPSWYLVSANDQMIPPPAQKLMANRMNAITRTADASHASLVSRPKEVVEVILEAAQSPAAK